jgi:drug/metabolite transporter (DMT)-like permease
VSRQGYIQLHLLVALYATTAIFGKLISLPAPEMVVWRTALAASGAALWVMVVSRKRLMLPLRTMMVLFGVGALVGLHWMFFFGAVKLANISICLAGLATTSFFTAFTEPLLEKRRIRPLEVLLGLLILIGISVVAGVERGQLPGLGLALAGAFLAAIFPVLNRQLVTREHLDPMVMVVWQMVGAFLICSATLLVIEGQSSVPRLFALQGYDWLWLLVLGWGCTVFAHRVHINLLRQISAYTGNLALNFEPVYGILAAAVLFSEHRELQPGFFLGVAAIVLANFLHPLILRRDRRKSGIIE